MTDSKSRIAASVTAAILSLGLAVPAATAWERQTAQPAASGGQHFVQAQDRGRSGSAFRTAPEFPPTGYLEEFDDAAQGRFERPMQEFARDSFPPAGASGLQGFSSDFPEYAPQGLGSRVPSSGLQGQSEQRGTGSSASRQMWGDPSFTPPAPGQDRRMPSADPGGAWGEWPSMPPVGGPRDRGDYPGMPAETGYPGWSGYPSEPPRRASPTTRPGSGPDHQWPLSPAPGGSYQAYPEYQPESWERTRPETPRDRFPSYRDDPRGDYRWGR